MCWRLHPTKYDFKVWHKQGKESTQANSISRFNTYRKKISDNNDDILTFITDKENTDKDHFVDLLH